MKKTYMKPLIEAREMEMESMFCESNGLSNELEKTNLINNSSQILSKENTFDLWGMDDEE